MSSSLKRYLVLGGTLLVQQPKAASTSGALLGITAELIPGTASGKAAAAGAVLGIGSELAPGLASGAASTPGAMLVASGTINTATASGAAAASGATFPTVATLDAGTASSATRGAQGALLEVGASLIPGAAHGQASTDRWQVVTTGVPINRNKPRSVAGRAKGAELGARAELIPGTASGSAAATGKALRGSLYYWRASQRTPEEWADIRARDKILARALLLMG